MKLSSLDLVIKRWHRPHDFKVERGMVFLTFFQHSLCDVKPGWFLYREISPVPKRPVVILVSGRDKLNI